MTGDDLTAVFPGDSEMARRMRAHDWAATPLGDASAWPEGLKVPLGMMLTSKFEMWLGWGEDLAFLYNDAYSPTLGRKHPRALGRPLAVVWKEVFAAIEDRIVSVMRDGVATWDEALLLIVDRNGAPEESYHTFSYSPLRGDGGSIDGLMCVVSEVTERVISERRLATLRTLAISLLTTKIHSQVIAATTTALRESERDFPFVGLFLDEVVVADSVVAAIDWPLPAAGEDHVIVPLDRLMREPPRGEWDIAPRDALVLPLLKSGQITSIGTLVLGLNPYRHPDDDVVGIGRLIAAQVSGALAAIDAHATESAEIERLRQLFEESPSFMAVLRGPEHRFELVNPGYRQLVGHRDLIGMTVRAAFPDIDGQGFLEMLDAVFAKGEAISGQSVPLTLTRTPDGQPEPRFVDFVYQPIRNGEGIVTGIFVEGHDVTDRHRANAAMRASEAQFRTLAEAMRNHAWTAQPDGQLDWFNNQVSDYSGLSHAELRGAGWAGMVHPDDVDASIARWSDALGSGAPYDNEFRLRRHDGDYRWHIARAVAQRGEDGAIVRWIGTNTDIHEQKEIAEELSDLNATLERQVDERTSALFAAEEALRHSQKMEAVGQLTGGIAHDFNNLLTVIRGSIEMIRQPGIAPEKRERYLTAIADTADRAAKLTAQLLAFARRQTLRPEMFDAAQAVRSLEGMIGTLTGSKIRIRYEAPVEPARVHADLNQFEASIVNMAINARDAMDCEGELRIAVERVSSIPATRERALVEGRYVAVAMTDTGGGIAPDKVDQIFEPFFTTKGVGKGTGLGLSQVFGFSRQSNGEIRVESEVGIGTVFTLYLPEAQNSDEAEPTAPKPAARRQDRRYRLLVVEDNEDVGRFATDALSEIGHDTRWVASAAEALVILEKDSHAFDMVFSDVVMAGMDGVEFARTVNRLYPHLPILLTSGYSHILSQYGTSGFELLQKPYSIDELSRSLDRAGRLEPMRR